MIHTIVLYLLLFFIYSFIGWMIEVICKLISDKKIINRGFLIGPYCPIYGTAALCMTILLTKYLQDPLILFIMSIVISGVLEYVTSYLMEKLFQARWWDYSTKRFHINGRVCLETVIPFGILGMVLLYLANPFFFTLIDSIPVTILHLITGILLIVYLVDNIISYCVILGFKHIATEVHVDSTEEIVGKVRAVIEAQGSKLRKRLIHAFPQFQAGLELVKKKKEEITSSISRNITEIKETVKKEWKGGDKKC